MNNYNTVVRRTKIKKKLIKLQVTVSLKLKDIVDDCMVVHNSAILVISIFTQHSFSFALRSSPTFPEE